MPASMAGVSTRSRTQANRRTGLTCCGRGDPTREDGLPATSIEGGFAPAAEMCQGHGVMSRLGVISDTHGWLRAEAVEALRGCDVIAHAGDVGDAEVLSQLRRMAVTYAVRGNSDRGSWCCSLPGQLSFQVDGLSCALVHELERLQGDPATEGHGLIISGHTHDASIRTVGSILYLNPGSAGPRRPGHRVTLCLVDIEAGRPNARIVHLPED